MSDLEQLIRRIVREEIAAARAPANDQVEHLTVSEYARRWSISESTVRAAIREKRLAVTRIGRAVRIEATATISDGPGDEVRARSVLRLLGGSDKVR